MEIKIWDPLRDLVPFVQLKKREKHLWRSVTFSKVADSRNALHMYVHNRRVINNDLNITGENMMEEQHNEGSNMYVNNEHRRMNFMLQHGLSYKHQDVKLRQITDLCYTNQHEILS